MLKGLNTHMNKMTIGKILQAVSTLHVYILFIMRQSYVTGQLNGVLDDKRCIFIAIVV